MADNGSQPGTSAESNKIIYNTLTENEIENFIQNIHGNTTIYQSTPSPSSTHAPRRNPINNIELAVDTFIGRETELSDIMQLFHEYPVVVIAAMGGMGKTQLARKFACINAKGYRDRYWINAETEEQLFKSFDRLAKKVKVDANTDIETVRDTYRSFTEGAALLIFDNVEHVNYVYKYLPTRIQLEDITLHVLITSRWTDWTCDEQIKCYKLQPMDISTSLQIFQRKFGQKCIETMQKEWKQLARMLGYLPLALQVATSYIYKRNKHNPNLRTVLADYMKQLKEGAAGLLNDPLTDYGNRSVYTSMMLTLEQLENKANNVSNVQNDVQWKLAVTIINCVAYMNPNTIYRTRLLILVDNHENIGKLDEALEILMEYSLLNQVVGRRWAILYSVHRIIQTSIRHNQTLIGTADMYYIRIFKCALADFFFSWDVFQYANEHASAVADYYKNNPSTTILKRLVKNKAITAMEAVLKLISKNQIQIAIKEHDLLHLAVGSGDLSMTKLLCKYGVDINQPSREDFWAGPPLHRALRGRNMDIATWLLENGAVASVRDWLGHKALHAAVECANHKVVSTIIKTDRAVLNETNMFGQTPLHVINYSENEEDILSTTRVLVENGADIAAVDNIGRTVLHSVSSSACAAAVSLILQQNKDLINIVNEYGKTALHVIPYDNSRIDNERILSTMHVLVDSGVDLTKEDKWGNTVLHSAAKDVCAAAVSLILQLNKHLINIVNEDGKTALHVLGNSFNFKYLYGLEDRRKQLFAETARVLIMNGLSLDTRDNAGCTPLDTVEPKFKDILLEVAEECNNQ